MHLVQKELKNDYKSSLLEKPRHAILKKTLKRFGLSIQMEKTMLCQITLISHLKSNTRA